MRVSLFIGLLLVAFQLGAASAHADDAMDRTVLALFDSAYEETPAHTMFHMNAETPLNHLGYIVRYHDMRQGVPEAGKLDGVVAIATMLTYDVDNADAYFRWLERAVAKVPRVIILRALGGPATPQARRSLNKRRWIVDPFEFLRAALDVRTFPVPDTTTLSGRRLYFSHVDGDGWNNLTYLERYRDPPTYSSQVMQKELIEPYPDLPASVGFVMSDGDNILGRGEEARAIARQIFALPRVEVASHTHTHPSFWEFFDHYRRETELRQMDREKPRENTGLVPRLRDMIGFGPSDTQRARQRYVANGNNLPRAYLRDALDLDKEVGDALRGAEALAPAELAAELMAQRLSADARPYLLKATAAAGMADPTFDLLGGGALAGNGAGL